MLLGASRAVQYTAQIKKTGWLPCIIETLTSVCPCVRCRCGTVLNFKQSVIKNAVDINYHTSDANFPDSSIKALNYLNFVSLNADKQHYSNCQQRESATEGTAENKTKESLIKRGTAITSAALDGGQGKITSGASMTASMAAHQDLKITSNPALL